MVIDIGSTFTKLRLFKDCKLMASVQSPTTIENVYKGIKDCKQQIMEKLRTTSIEAKYVLATSSAAGGLRMVAMGYMVRVTAKAAKEVAMNAGARVLEIISHEDSPDYRIQILREINPDIILLAGGTDGGDETSIIENASLIVESGVNAVVVVAGNINVQSEVANILKKGNVNHKRVPNIMPTIHKLRVNEARESIHKEFIRQITKAHGLRALQQEITNEKVIPTPGAVLLAAELLAKGTDSRKGLGEIIVVDLGGATTDIHSVLPKIERLRDEEIGLIVTNEKQTSYRTVEGNLGLRVSALGILEAAGTRNIIARRNLKGKHIEEDMTNYCKFLEKNTGHIAQDEKELMFDMMLAETAVEVALKRHAGYISQEYDSVLGILPGMPVGRDLRVVKKVVGVGGVFAHLDLQNAKQIIKNALKNPGFSLLPKDPEILIDSKYIMSTAGTISQNDQGYAFNILKNNFDFKLGG